LQEISDSVAEVQWNGSIADALEECKAEQATLDKHVVTCNARQRYLDHLARSKEDGVVDEDEGICILCQCPFVRGFITQWSVVQGT